MPTRTKKELSATIETIGIEEAKSLVGYEEVDKKGQFSMDGPDGDTVQFNLKNNKANRPFEIGLAKQYSEQMFRGEWAGQQNSPSKTTNGESWVVDAKGQVVSCAHRAVALIMAEYRRQRYEKMDRKDVLKDLKIKGEITVQAVVVRNVDPKCADTADTGKNRKLGDVLFRRDMFSDVKDDNDKPLAESVKKRLHRELAVALRLVWLRTHGESVKGGTKLFHPEAVNFMDQHPLLRDCIEFMWAEEGGSSSVEGKKITGYVSLGYAAGLMYLQAFSGTEREAVEDGSVDLTAKPDRWDDAEKFWTSFAQESYTAKKHETIKHLHKVLERNAASEEAKFSRDALCTVICRSWLVYRGENEKKWQTARALSTLYDKGELQFVRVGGFDVDRDYLRERGILEDEVVVRQAVSNWKLHEPVWVHDETNMVNWFGRITNFSDDGQNAIVMDLEEEAEYIVPVEYLCVEKPEEFEEAEEESETEEVA